MVCLHGADLRYCRYITKTKVIQMPKIITSRNLRTASQIVKLIFLFVGYSYFLPSHTFRVTVESSLKDGSVRNLFDRGCIPLEGVPYNRL